MSKIPRIEQETIIIYDVELEQWEVYTNYPPHIRKYRDKVIPKREEFYSDGTEKMLDGIIEGSVGVFGKRKMSDKQKKEFVKRMKETNRS
jgi:hypothetical protein